MAKKYKPITIEELYLKPVQLKMDGHIIVDSINNNSYDWQMDKTIESLVQLANGIIKNRRNLLENTEIANMVADAAIQIEILCHMFGKQLVQNSINNRLVGMGNRVIKLNAQKNPVGFGGMT